MATYSALTLVWVKSALKKRGRRLIVCPVWNCGHNAGDALIKQMSGQDNDVFQRHCFPVSGPLTVNPEGACSQEGADGVLCFAALLGKGIATPLAALVNCRKEFAADQSVAGFANQVLYITRLL